MCVYHILHITRVHITHRIHRMPHNTHVCISHTSYYAFIIQFSTSGNFAPPGHVWQRLAAFLAVTTGMCYWHLGSRQDAARNPTACGTASHKVPVIRPKISTVLRRRKRDPYGHTEENVQTEQALSTARGTRLPYALARYGSLAPKNPVSH